MDGTPCWSCGNPAAADDACRWCGVWLVELDARRVPPALGELLPLARRWGIGDDGYRSAAVEAATPAERTEIVAAVDRLDAALDEWLVGPAADDSPTREYVALTCLTMAYDEVRLR